MSENINNNKQRLLTLRGMETKEYFSDVPVRCTVTVLAGDVQVVFCYMHPLPERVSPKVGKDSTAGSIAAAGSFGVVAIRVIGTTPGQAQFILT